MMQIIKQLLREVKYPLINFDSANLEEIAEVFSLENINVFFKWFIKESCPTANLDFNSSEELVNILCNLGFCASHEIKPFANGTLDFNEQINIILRMLINLKKKQISQTIDESYTKVTFEEIEQYLDSLKVDPAYEQIKYTNKERNQHIKDMGDEIEGLEESVKQLEDELKKEQSLCIDISETETSIEDDDDSSLIKAVGTFQLTSQEFEKKCSEMIQNEKPNFSENFASKLEDCVKVSEEYLKVVKDISAIKDFKITPIQLPDKYRKEEDFIKKMLPLAEEIINN